ncbi:DNA helicase [Cytophagales bacterium WSM2-2]|nr:DNA helicase [Cytophagales bacterium WSM2-2]
MKDRIMLYLDAFASGKPNELASELQTELGLDAPTFQNYSRDVQAEILHNYHQFSISTIDAFFQKVIRAFTREAGILGDYQLEVENDDVMEQVISNLIGELGADDQLTNWVVELALQNLENDRSWDMRSSLAAFSNEIFREEFRSVEEESSKFQTKNFFPGTLKVLREKKYEFVNLIRSRIVKLLRDIHAAGFHSDDFKYSGGVHNFLEKFKDLNSVKDFNDKEKGSRPDNEYQVSKNWPVKDHPRTKEMISLADSKWIAQLNEILEFRKKNFQVALSAELALDNFYAFGLLTDISRKLGEYKKDNNLMLLADAPQFLNGIIRDSDTPFIYEKSGSFYRNFLIDEFQDTSGLQWKNFQPLLTNSLDSGYRSLIVGDVKQAVYRWRGGDQRLLTQAKDAIGKGRVQEESLTNNFRSAQGIVAFNNELFKVASEIASLETGLSLSSNEYADVEQKPVKSEEGFVHVKFLADEFDARWNDIAMEQTVLQIEEMQSRGVKAQDIALLVRRNDEGERIISFLLEHKNSDKAKPDCKYDVVSSESLRIDSAASVNLLVAVLTYLLNPQDDIARAQLAYEYARQQEEDKALSDIFADSHFLTIENILPAEFARRKISLRKLPLFELTETLIELFELNKNVGEIPYLLAFQDLVLEFAYRERNDIGAFLTWWSDNKHKKSIVAPAAADAMQLFTVHKAKGLQFKFVIIPFCAWGIDHESIRPNLWVKSVNSIFKDIGYLPVRYSSTLKESLFADDYTEEHSRIFLDNFNLLYVALTRAEKGLVVFAPDTSVPRIFKASVAQIIYEALERSTEFSKSWDAKSKTFTLGSIDSKAETLSSTAKTTSLINYNTTSWRSKLVIKHSSQAVVETIEDEQRKKINYGIYLHTAFAQVRFSEDIPKAIDRLESDGSINAGEKQILTQRVQELLKNPQVADWFSPEWEIRNEVHSLLPGGKEYRIDRLLLKGKQAVVIDFKTGEQRKDDHKQMNEYCTMLTKMGFNAEGYLLYLMDGEVVNVVPPKPSGKKNKNQLGLDF